MKRLLVIALVVGVIVAACGGDDDSSADGPQGGGATEVATAADTATPASSGDSTSGGGTAATSKPIGPVAVNTIQIGDTTWTRTLPMVSGQCILYKDDGTLPTWATVWGTLEGNDDIRFSVGVSQDGTYKARVQSDVETDTWLRVAGPASPGVDDLEVELDLDTLTITGEGTFTLFVFGDPQPGSFHFQCDPSDQ